MSAEHTHQLPELPEPEPESAAEFAAHFGISKAGLYAIAAVLDTEGHRVYAREVPAAADYIEELILLPDAYDAFMEVMVERGRQNEPTDEPEGACR
jgi:hypothetical protein